MSKESPFSHLFQLFGRVPEKHVDSINKDAFEKMVSLLAAAPELLGRCILLRAPRAGYGKSHLLSRVQQQLGSTHEFILLQPADGYRVDAAAALNDVLAKITRSLPGGAGLTVLDLLARKIFALGLEPLVRSGEVPCQDRETALTALQNRPTETFDFHHPTAVTAHWARDHFEILGPRLVVEIAQILAAPLREVGFWVDVMFRYSVTPVDQPGRSGMLMAAVADAQAASMNDRLTTLLKMLSHQQRVVLVADELEGMSANEEAALRLAAFVTTLRHGADRVDIVISVNDDVWESAFVPRLSGGLQDRLSEAVVRLEPLTRDQAVALLQSRQADASASCLDALVQDGGPLYSRAVLRSAASTWVAPIEEAAPVSAAIKDEEPIVAASEEPEIAIASETPEAAEPVAIAATEQTLAPALTSAAAIIASEVVEAPPAAPLSPATMEVNWKASDREALGVGLAETVTIPEKPVFVAPILEETLTPVAAAESPAVEAVAAVEVPAEIPAAPQTPWWEQHTGRAFSAEPQATDVFASTPFNEPESPFVSEAPVPQPEPVSPFQSTPIEEIAPVAAVATTEFTAVPVATEPVAFVPREIEVVSFQAPIEAVVEPQEVIPTFTPSAPTPPVEPVYGIPSESAFTSNPYESQPYTQEPVNPTPVSQSPYGAVAENLAPDFAQTADTAQNKEIDRVDELLRQFRERYGRS